MREGVRLRAFAVIAIICVALAFVTGYQETFKRPGHVAPVVRMVFDRALELR